MTTTRRAETPTGEVRKRVWVQHVAVQAAMLETRLRVLRARAGEDPAVDELAAGIERLLHRARDAAFRDNPIPSRWAIWWHGTLIEAAFQNLHAAEALLVGLYDEAAVDAEIPEAVARAETGLQRDDPRRAAAIALVTPTASRPDYARRRELLRKTIEVGHAYSDQQHARLRSFRNLVLGAAVMIAVFVAAFILVVRANPAWVPLCFEPEGGTVVCPTGATAASGNDVLIVALLGLLGGVLAGAVAIRRISGTSSPYDVPTALALLKAPFGAMTALGALIAIRGDIVPGLSALDTQVQILAYALIFGYGQQLLTGLIDRQAQAILDHVPSPDSAIGRPEVALPGAVPGTVTTATP